MRNPAWAISGKGAGDKRLNNEVFELQESHMAKVETCDTKWVICTDVFLQPLVIFAQKASYIVFWSPVPPTPQMWRPHLLLTIRQHIFIFIAVALKTFSPRSSKIKLRSAGLKTFSRTSFISPSINCRIPPRPDYECPEVAFNPHGIYPDPPKWVSEHCDASFTRFETPVLMDVGVGLILRALRATVNLQWQDILNLLLPLSGRIKSGNLSATPSSLMLCSPLLYPSSFVNTATFLGIWMTFCGGGFTCRWLLDPLVQPIAESRCWLHGNTLACG